MSKRRHSGGVEEPPLERTEHKQAEPPVDGEHDGPTGTSATERPLCMRCGFPVKSRAWGCQNPCSNCGFVYPLGDCSD